MKEKTHNKRRPWGNHNAWKNGRHSTLFLNHHLMQQPYALSTEANVSVMSGLGWSNPSPRFRACLPSAFCVLIKSFDRYSESKHSFGLWQWIIHIFICSLSCFVKIFLLLLFRSRTLGGKSPLKKHCMLNLLKSPITSIAVHVKLAWSRSLYSPIQSV